MQLHPCLAQPGELIARCTSPGRMPTQAIVDMWPTAFGQVPDVMTLQKWLDEI